MDTTPPSLLEQLREPTNHLAWRRFVELYTPLLHHWAMRLGLQAHDADNLVQEVLLTLLDSLARFEYQPGRRFRGWLWTVLRNKHRRMARRNAPGELTEPEIPAPTEPIQELEEAEYRRYLVDRVLRLMRADFEPATWQACWRTVVEEAPAAQVAAELGITVNAVHLAKSRVLRRLRQELAGLLD
ncbi:MAG: sigma-70 family RNA polymerase sigma factor [Gemmataceae bacterium]